LGIGLEVELLVELSEFFAGSEGEELAGHDGEDPEISGGVFDESGHEFCGHEVGVSGLVEDMVEPVEEFFGGEVVEAESDSDATGDGEEFLATELLDEAAITGEDDGQDGSGIEVGGGEDSEFGEDVGVHFLCFIDEEDGSEVSGFDVSEPFFAQGLETSPSVVGDEGDAEECAEFTVAVPDTALGTGQDADIDVREHGEVVGEEAEGS
jgi:hypothetical protein